MADSEVTGVVGIGIIGAGRICAAHAASALALPETQLVGIADVDAARLAQATERYGCRGYAGYQEMLQDDAVQAVIIGLPHFLHRDVTVGCLQAGRHVLLEKPMAMTVPECDAMIAAAAASGKNLMVAHSQQFFPVNQEVRKVLRDGAIGDLVLASDTWYKPFYDGVRPAWFLKDSEGGGMWPMNGSHMIDRLMFFLDSRVVAVKAKVGNPIHGVSSDMGLAFLDFANGLSATIQHAGYKDGVNRFEVELTGTEAQLKVDGNQAGNASYLISRGGKWDEVSVAMPELPVRAGATPPSPAFGAEVREFALSVLEGRAPSVTAEYGRHVVRVLEACVESSATGREVRLDT